MPPEGPIKLLVPAHRIPHGAKVMKRSGRQEHTLLRKVIVYGQDGERKTITANDGTVFVTSKAGNYNVYAATTEFVWLADPSEVYEYLKGDSCK